MGSDSLKRLATALDLHSKGEEEKALQIYTELLEKGITKLPLFVNTSVLLRKNERPSDAISLLQRGLNIYPNDSGLYNNMGNCLVDLDNDRAAVLAYRKSLQFNKKSEDARISLIACLTRLGYRQLAYHTALSGYYLCDDKFKFLVSILENLYRLPESQRGSDQLLSQSINKIEGSLLADPDQDQIQTLSVLVQLWTSLGDLDKALDNRSKLSDTISSRLAEKKGQILKSNAYKNWHAIGWNLSINLLKQGRLKEGWDLFDHGLLVKAPGPQRWQRSLKKPFSSNEVSIWTGQSLHNKSILFLGEQGIGDTMMFASVIQLLCREGAKLYLLCPDRLLSMYKRSFNNVTIVSNEDLKNFKYRTSTFDYQSPIGSICKYRFTTIQSYQNNPYKLFSDTTLTSELRAKYYDGRPLVGISWQGGGKTKIIKDKSVYLKDWAPILKSSDFKFVSLQYGDDKPLIDRVNKALGVHIDHDETINPLQNMDDWLSQVDAMDYVITVANTTVHGAAG